VVVALLVGLALAVPVGMAAAAPPAMVRPSALAPAAPPAGSAAIGPVPASKPLDLQVVLAPSNNTQLQSLLQNLYDPKSPDYHRWLQPGQFAHQPGPSASQISSVDSWLHGAGLTQTKTSAFAVSVSAPASTVSAALATSFEQYRVPSGHLGYLAKSAPQVPRSLSTGQITAILGLDTLAAFQLQTKLTSTAVRSSAVVATPGADGLTPCAAAEDKAGTTYWTLDRLGAQYGTGSLLSDGQNGHGETIGLYENGQANGTDIGT